MRLVGKLALVLSGILFLVLSAALFWTYRSVQARLGSAQESAVRLHLGRLARHCGDAWGVRFERVCSEALYYTIEMTEPSAFSAAWVMDEGRRIMLHSDFLRNDFSSRGKVEDDGDIRLEADASGSFALRKEGKRIYGEPIAAGGKRVATMVAVFQDAELRRALPWTGAAMWHPIALACLLGSGLGIALSLILAYHFLSPLDAIAEAAWKVGGGDFRIRVPAERKDELGQLGLEFNRMIGRLAELDELKGSFTAKITHDLKTPLSAIQGGLGNVLAGLKGPLIPAQAEELKLVVQNGQALTELINHILEVTQLEAGKAAFEMTAIDLESEIGSVLELIRPRSDEFGVAVSFELEPGLSQAFADAQAFRRILRNLVSNALKFTPKGGRVVVKARRSARNEATFSVSDTGIGIPQDRIGSLFKKFSQVPETRNKVREAGGSGLGLVICKELVEAHSGRIWVESVLLRGTTFHFTLPETGPRLP